jgi:O-antigen/teichoic acid export membrane protein
VTTIVPRLNAPIALTFCRILTAVAGLATAPLIARALGPADRGLVAAVLAVLGVCPIVMALGTPLAVRRRAATSSDVSGLVRSARLFGLTSVVPCLAISVALLQWIFVDLSMAEGMLFLAAMVLCPLTISWMVDVNVLVARREYLKVAAVQSTQGLGFSVGILLCWSFFVINVSTIIVCTAIASVAAAILGACLTSVGTLGYRSDFFSLVREGARLSGSQIAEVAQHRLDQILVLPLIGASAAGQYSVAVTIGGLPIVLAHALAASRFPEFANTVGLPGLRELHARSVRASLAMGLLSSCCLAIVSPYLIPRIFGDQFSSVVPVTLIILIGSAGLVACYMCSMALVASDRGLAMTVAQCIGLVAGSVSLLVLGPLWGPIGAGIASSLGYLISFGVSCYLLNILGMVPSLTFRDLREGFQILFRTGR